MDLRVGKHRSGMGFNLGTTPVVDGIREVESMLDGPCFEGLNFMRRLGTSFGVALALSATKGYNFGTTFVRLARDGWTIDPISVAAGPPLTPVPHAEPVRENISELIAKSYDRDYSSHQARMAVERVDAEAAGDADEDDDAPLYPELAAFRKNFLSLERV